MNKSRRNFLVQLGSAALFGAGTAAGIHSLTATSAFGPLRIRVQRLHHRLPYQA